jgi:Leucine-rich repeat (LRR) protein
MFEFFKKKTVPGEAEYLRFKELANDRNAISAFMAVDSGMSSGVPLNLHSVVQEMVNLSYSLTSMTGLHSSDLINCAQANDWKRIEVALEKFSKAIESYKGTVESELKAIAIWADNNKIPELQKFDSGAYPVTGMPRDPQELLNLRFINIQRAGLDNLPPAIGVLPLIQAVCLSENRFKDMPLGLFNLKGLQRLDMDQNSIEIIPNEISNLLHVHTMDLDDNNINTISPRIQLCRSLKKLFLKNQKHQIKLNMQDSPLTDEMHEALAHLEYSRHVNVKY